MRRAFTRRLPAHLPMVLMLGVTCQVGQVVVLRELLMVFHGNELSLGIILASWMLWVGIGSGLGAAALRRWPDAERLLRIDAALVALLLPATVLLIRALPAAFDAPPGALLSLFDMVVASLTLTAPLTTLLGAQFVLLARIWRARDPAGEASGAAGAAKTYVGEAAGNALGGLAFTLVLVHHLDAIQTALAVGAAMLAAVLAGRRPVAGRRGRRRRPGADAAGVAARRRLDAAPVAAAGAAVRAARHAPLALRHDRGAPPATTRSPSTRAVTSCSRPVARTNVRSASRSSRR
jgi:hypothetical protein